MGKGTRAIRFEVSKSDIEKGKPGRAAFCPIALAFKRQFRNVDAVLVTQHFATAYLKPRTFFGIFLGHREPKRYIMSGKGAAFITNFDSYNLMQEPITLELQPYT